MKKIMVITVLIGIVVGRVNSQELPGILKIVTFNSVDMHSKVITLNGKKYPYLITDGENSFINIHSQHKKLNHLKKGEMVIVKLTKLNSAIKNKTNGKKDKYLVTYIAERKESF